METVAAWCFSCTFMLIAGVVAVVLLGLRDSIENRAREERRPLEDRIRDFEESAAFHVKELPRLAERAAAVNRPAPWIPAVIDYYRRLGELAASPTTTAEEVLALADEASQYESEQKLKGLFISGEARQLAALLRRRSQPPTSPS